MVTTTTLEEDLADTRLAGKRAPMPSHSLSNSLSQSLAFLSLSLSR